MKDLSNYIGIPFVDLGRGLSGMDCWGLVRHFYLIEKGIRLPDFVSYESSSDSDAVSKIIQMERSNWILTDEPEFGDVIVFRIFGKPTHVGIYVSYKAFLHSFRNIGSCKENLTSPLWANRIEGFFRYE